MTDSQKQQVQLRPMTDSDLKLVLSWRNHLDIRQHMYTQDEISYTAHSSWFKTVSVETGRYLLILEVDTVPLGYVNFRCDTTGDAEWGFYLAPEAPKGTGKMLGEAATRYAFEEIGLNILWGEVLPDNLASQNFHLRHGFVLESIIPDKIVGGRHVENIHRYILTRDTWQSHQVTT